MKNSTHKILLSICIPTYNRSTYLRKTLLSIVNQDSFASKCEIVISDNNSSDDTKIMVNSEFIPKYKNIRYYCNEKNVVDHNFIIVMNLARGKYIKLHGDRICFEDGSLSKLLDYICNYDYGVFFLLNGNNDATVKNIIGAQTFNQFVEIVSFFSTWITGIIFRNADYMKIDNKDRYVKYQLSQTDILFRMITVNNGHSLIISEKMMYDQQPEPGGRTNYNLCEIFLKNYLTLYQYYLQSGILSKKIYKNEKIKLLRGLILPRLLRQTVLRNSQYKYDLSNSILLIIKYYWSFHQLYFYPIYLLKKKLGKILTHSSKAKNEGSCF